MYHSVSFWPTNSRTGYLNTGYREKEIQLTVDEYWKDIPVDCGPFDTEVFLDNVEFHTNATAHTTGTPQYLDVLNNQFFVQVYDPNDDNTILNSVAVTFSHVKKENKVVGEIVDSLNNILYSEFLKGYDRPVILRIICGEGDNRILNTFSNPLITLTVRYRENISENETTGYNTWASWRLIPSSRPFIGPPNPKTTYQEIPYVNGKIDLSEFGIPDIAFENRTGSGDFIVMNDMLSGYDRSKLRINDGNAFSPLMMRDGKAKMWSWDQTYSTIMNLIHGKRLKVVLEDDPSYYYIGRTSVEGLGSEEHWTTISFNFDVEPFKKERFSTAEDWIWDAIDFEADLDILGMKDLELDPGKMLEYNFRTLRHRVYPSIKISGLNPGEVISVYINENNSTTTRKINLQNGTNNHPASTKWSQSYDEEVNVVNKSLYDLYFEGDSNISFKLISASIRRATITVDFRLEGL